MSKQEEAKRTKALRSREARQKEKKYKEDLQLQLQQTVEEIDKLKAEKEMRQQRIDQFESSLRQQHQRSLLGSEATADDGNLRLHLPLFPSVDLSGSPCMRSEDLSESSTDYGSDWSTTGDMKFASFSGEELQISSPSSSSLPPIATGTFHDYSRPSTSATSESSRNLSSFHEPSEECPSSQTMSVCSSTNPSKKSKNKSKTFFYQQPPQNNPHEEEKRQRAKRARENRQKQKEYMSQLQSQITNINHEIQILKNDKQELEGRIDSLQGNVASYLKKGRTEGPSTSEQY